MSRNSQGRRFKSASSVRDDRETGWGDLFTTGINLMADYFCRTSKQTSYRDRVRGKLRRSSRAARGSHRLAHLEQIMIDTRTGKPVAKSERELIKEIQAFEEYRLRRKAKLQKPANYPLKMREVNQVVTDPMAIFKLQMKACSRKLKLEADPRQFLQNHRSKVLKPRQIRCQAFTRKRATLTEQIKENQIKRLSMGMDQADHSFSRLNDNRPSQLENKQKSLLNGIHDNRERAEKSLLDPERNNISMDIPILQIKKAGGNASLVSKLLRSEDSNASFLINSRKREQELSSITNRIVKQRARTYSLLSPPQNKQDSQVSSSEHSIASSRHKKVQGSGRVDAKSISKLLQVSGGIDVNSNSLNSRESQRDTMTFGHRTELNSFVSDLNDVQVNGTIEKDFTSKKKGSINSFFKKSEFGKGSPNSEKRSKREVKPYSKKLRDIFSQKQMEEDIGRRSLESEKNEELVDSDKKEGPRKQVNSESFFNRDAEQTSKDTRSQFFTSSSSSKQETEILKNKTSMIEEVTESQEKSSTVEGSNENSRSLLESQPQKQLSQDQNIESQEVQEIDSKDAKRTNESTQDVETSKKMEETDEESQFTKKDSIDIKSSKLKETSATKNEVQSQKVSLFSQNTQSSGILFNKISDTQPNVTNMSQMFNKSEVEVETEKGQTNPTSIFANNGGNNMKIPVQKSEENNNEDVQVQQQNTTQTKSIFDNIKKEEASNNEGQVIKERTIINPSPVKASQSVIEPQNNAVQSNENPFQNFRRDHSNKNSEIFKDMKGSTSGDASSFFKSSGNQGGNFSFDRNPKGFFLNKNDGGESTTNASFIQNSGSSIFANRSPQNSFQNSDSNNDERGRGLHSIFTNSSNNGSSQPRGSDFFNKNSNSSNQDNNQRSSSSIFSSRERESSQRGGGLLNQSRDDNRGSIFARDSSSNNRDSNFMRNSRDSGSSIFGNQRDSSSIYNSNTDNNYRSSSYPNNMNDRRGNESDFSQRGSSSSSIFGNRDQRDSNTRGGNGFSLRDRNQGESNLFPIRESDERSNYSNSSQNYQRNVSSAGNPFLKFNPNSGPSGGQEGGRRVLKIKRSSGMSGSQRIGDYQGRKMPVNNNNNELQDSESGAGCGRCQKDVFQELLQDGDEVLAVLPLPKQVRCDDRDQKTQEERLTSLQREQRHRGPRTHQQRTEEGSHGGSPYDDVHRKVPRVLRDRRDYCHQPRASESQR